MEQVWIWALHIFTFYEETLIISDLSLCCSVKNKKKTVTCEWRDFVARANSRGRQISQDVFTLIKARSSNKFYLKIRVKKFKISFSFLYFLFRESRMCRELLLTFKYCFFFYEGREEGLEARDKQRIWSIVPQNALPAGRCILQSKVTAFSVFFVLLSPLTKK